MKAYCLGKSIILPHVRLISQKGRDGRDTMMMFHSTTIKTNGKHKTLGCNNMDDSGFCRGHMISRKEFLEKYCGGTEPDTKEGKL